MDKKNTTALYAQNLDEILFHLKSVPDLRIYGSGTGLDSIGDTMLFTRGIQELQNLDRRERYIDMGSAVSLSDIYRIGQKRLPTVFFEALKSVSMPFVRNIATIGGNICTKKHPCTLFAPLLALEAQFEFRTPHDIVFIPAGKYAGAPENALLTKIRLPLSEWDIQIYRRLGPEHIISNTSGVFIFLAAVSKGTLSDIRIVFSGKTSFRYRELENNLTGIKLPLPVKAAEQMLENAAQTYDNRTFSTDATETVKTETGVLRQQFLNLLSYSLRELT